MCPVKQGVRRQQGVRRTPSLDPQEYAPTRTLNSSSCKKSVNPCSQALDNQLLQVR